MATDLIAALDIGGTKTQLVIETADGHRLLDVTEPSLDWEAEPAAAAAAWIATRVERHLPADGRLLRLAFGAQGIDRAETAQRLQQALGARGYRAVAVNDATLLVPAAGLAEGIGVIAGTGSIAVGTDAEGDFMSAGGWGWVIGDEGGGAALVREATRAALDARDAGQPDDGLLAALVADFGVDDAERLTRRVNDEPTMDNWAPHAPAVFRAAAAGSALAQGVVAAAGLSLAGLVGKLRRRGAVGRDVVVAGSVIVNQPSLFEAFSTGLRRIEPEMAVHVLRVSPVEGAVVLARRAVDR